MLTQCETRILEYEEGCDEFYAVTNATVPHYYSYDGEPDKPGLKICIPHLDHQAWKKYSAALSIEPIIGASEASPVSPSDQVITEILYEILKPDSQETGWKITDVRVGCGELYMSLYCHELYCSRLMLERREREIADQSGTRPDLTSWLPPDQYLLSWCCNPATCDYLPFEIAPSDTDEHQYSIHIGDGKTTYVTETGKQYQRKLTFREAQEYTPREGMSAVKVNIYESRL